MSRLIDVAIIGCGMFGAEIALKARTCGLSVVVYEAKKDILSGASMNNQNRLHLGFHYPRDLETGKQSIRGFEAFKQKYAACIQGGFPNAYFIANRGSLTSPKAYQKFCGQLGVPYRRISAGDFPVAVRGADTGILCDEVVYDCTILRELVWQQLRRAGVDVVIGERVVNLVSVGERYRIESSSRPAVLADVVVNASYGDINRLTEQLGHPVTERLFEYTVVPIIRLDIPRVGITIMDGPFMTVLPHGRSDNFLLYNVEHTIVAKAISSQLELKWLRPESAPFASVDKMRYFEKMNEVCKEYVPALERAEVIGFLEGPRMVLARREYSDARPSIVTSYEDTYLTVFAGKIDHCMWVADDVCRRLKAKFML
jgi:glycine/D-amino acid oxidase-like deaminating enzyme